MITKFILTFVTFIIADYIWLGLILNKYMKSLLGDLMAEKVNMIAVVFVYIILSASVLFIVSKTSTPTQALFYGAVFGFVVYAIYEFTNLSFITKWPKSKLILIKTHKFPTFLCIPIKYLKL
jgi:uncharacterized membrane protein